MIGFFKQTFGFKERIRASITMDREKRVGNVGWNIIASHPDFTEDELKIALATYYYARALNLVDAKVAPAVLQLLSSIARRTRNSLEPRPGAFVLPEKGGVGSLEDVAALSPEQTNTFTAALSVANNGLSPAVLNFRLRQTFDSASALILARHLAASLPAADALRAADAILMMQTTFQSAGSPKTWWHESNAPDAALKAIGVWKRERA